MEKDYSKYFKGPSLKEAKHRGKEKVQILEDDFFIPEDMKNVGVGKTYFIKTYGCQANERDSETMRGILEMMGYQATDIMEEADVVLLNTCAIRENAELKVFGKIGDLKRIKRSRPDMIFGMCGCMAQEEEVVARLLEKHPHTDLIFGTHNSIKEFIPHYNVEYVLKVKRSNDVKRNRCRSMVKRRGHC